MSLRSWLALSMLAATCAAQAEPYVPSSEATVLERGLPKRMARAVDAPQDVASALRLAADEVEQGRRLADPRHFGRAQALLSPWWEASDPPAGVLLLRGTIRQSLHEFTAARADLERLVAREPRNAQAWLMLATVEQVTGRLESARDRCRRLEGVAPELVAAACMAGVEGVTGEAAKGMARLDAAIAASPRAPAGLTAWARSLQGELALRVGNETLAMRSFALSLAIDPGDIYTRAAYADLLIDQRRPEEALRLVRGYVQADALLLRAAIAARAANDAEAPVYAERMARRIEAARRGGDRTHLREQARFALHVSGDARAALELARENWTQQKEPADARVFLEAALAAGRPGEARHVAGWVRLMRLQDPRIEALLERRDAA